MPIITEVGRRPANTTDDEIVLAILTQIPGHIEFRECAVHHILSVVAQTLGMMFEQFRIPNISYCPATDEILGTMIMGGALHRIGWSDRLKCSPHTTGPYGKSVLARFTPAQQEFLGRIASAITRLSQT